MLAKIYKNFTETLRQNKRVLRFLGIFLGSYILLTGGYQFYLQHEETSAHAPDFITRQVAKQSGAILSGLGYAPKLFRYSGQPAIGMFVRGQTRLKVVEGCNGISVLILFAAFVLAFYDGRKKTLIFLLAGGTLLYVMNTLRIALLAIGFIKFPAYKDFLHGTLFPGIIYGSVFLLWIIWVRGVLKKPES